MLGSRVTPADHQYSHHACRGDQGEGRQWERKHREDIRQHHSSELDESVYDSIERNKVVHVMAGL